MVRELQAFGASLGWPEPEIIAERDVSAWYGNGARKGRWPEVMNGLGTLWDGLLVRSLDRSARDIVETVNLVRLYGRGGFVFRAMNGDTLDDPKSATIRGLVSQGLNPPRGFQVDHFRHSVDRLGAMAV